MSKGRIFILVIFLCLGLAFNCKVVKGEPVFSDDFEVANNGKGIPDGWNTVTSPEGAQANYSLVTEGVFSGKKCLKITTLSSNLSYASCYQDIKGLENNKRYILSLYYRTEDAEGICSVYIGMNKVFLPSTEWKQIKASFTTGADGRVRVQLFSYLKKGSVLFDKLEVLPSKEEGDVTPQGKNLIGNPSFEVDADEDGLPDGWFADSFLFTLDADEVKTGKRSIKRAVPPIARQMEHIPRYMWQANIPLSPNTFYTFSIWHKDISPRENFGIYLIEKDQKGKIVDGGEGNRIMAAEAWTKSIISVITCSRAGGGEVLLEGGHGWRDDVELEKGLNVQEFLQSEKKEVDKLRKGSSTEVKFKDVDEAIQKMEQALKEEISSAKWLELLEKYKKTKSDLQLLLLME